jgi:hypothetical protein
VVDPAEGRVVDVVVGRPRPNSPVQDCRNRPAGFADDAVHQQVGLGILAECASTARVDFTHLKTVLEFTDGNLGCHLQILEQAGLVTIERVRDASRPRGWMRIARRGRAALECEIVALRAILDAIDPHRGADALARTDVPTRAVA